MKYLKFDGIKSVTTAIQSRMVRCRERKVELGYVKLGHQFESLSNGLNGEGSTRCHLANGGKKKEGRKEKGNELPLD